MRYLTAPLLALAALTLPLQAQPIGIGFVYAPEQALAYAVAETPAQAFVEATRACMADGALAEDCLPVSWCFPAQWSVDVFAMLDGGPHWREFHCGLPTEAIARAVAAQICDLALRPELSDCGLVRVIDPDGREQAEPLPK